MNYKGKDVIVSGHNGFIGKALVSYLESLGANVEWPLGDLRSKISFDCIKYPSSASYFFHFGSPSSQVLFKRNTRFCIDSTINSFLNVVEYCGYYGIKLIYPSTGLLSNTDFGNEYSRCKKICEDIHLGSNIDALGLRIFAGYGIGEEHKGSFSSVVNIFLHDMMIKCKSPTIYGDGCQTRDFIYIDDLVRAIATLADECSDHIVDVGSGLSLSFNSIVEEINSALGKCYIPNYVDVPRNYIKNTTANTKTLREYDCLPSIPIEKGIRMMIDRLRS